MLGHRTHGSGRQPVVVMNDWICDTSTWDGARAYLDGAKFTWAFADLRGYGRSMGRGGEFTVEEAAADVIDLADTRGWPRFAIVGHSMSALVALHLAQHRPDRIERVVVVAPPPPASFGADAATLEAIRAMARADDAARLKYLRARLGDRMSEGWVRFKTERWRACADPEAVAAYAAMFASRGLPHPTARVEAALLAVTGEQDAEPMRAAAVAKWVALLCERFAVTPLVDCGHYPMQEAPPLLVGTVERFLAS